MALVKEIESGLRTTEGWSVTTDSEDPQTLLGAAVSVSGNTAAGETQALHHSGTLREGKFADGSCLYLAHDIPDEMRGEIMNWR